MNGSPKKYQEQAISLGYKSLKDNGFYALYMEPQMGKTYTALSLMEMAKLDGITKFVFWSSATLLDNTLIQIGVHCTEFSTDRVRIYRSSKLKGKAYRDDLLSMDWDVLLVNYEAMANPSDELLYLFKMMGKNVMHITDEETKLKNPQSKRVKNIAKIFSPAMMKLGLTGTPLAESNIDLYAPWQLRKKGFWGMNHNAFKSEYCIIGTVYAQGGVAREVIKGNKNTEKLKATVAPYCFTAVRSDWLNVPAEDHQNIYFNLSPKESKAYDEMKDRLFTMADDGELYKVKNKVGLYNKFRCITGGFIDEESPISDDLPTKMSTLLDVLEDTGGQVIIWSCFRNEIAMLQRELSKLGPTKSYFGDVPMDERSKIMEEFKAGKIKYLVANPDAGAYGHSLQICNTQIFYSLPSSYEKFRQAKDRIQGIGAGSEVFYIYLIAKGRVDEKIQEALERKESASDLFMSYHGKDFSDFI